MSLIAAEEVANVIPGEPWMYGLGGFVALVGLLYVVSRFNPHR
jgi:hypothetical protein